MEDKLRHARHDLRGKINALKLCVSALEIVKTPKERLEFIDMIEQSGKPPSKRLRHAGKHPRPSTTPGRAITYAWFPALFHVKKEIEPRSHEEHEAVPAIQDPVLPVRHWDVRTQGNCFVLFMTSWLTFFPLQKNAAHATPSKVTLQPPPHNTGKLAGYTRIGYLNREFRSAHSSQRNSSMQTGNQFSRRDMLKTTAAIGAAATLASFGTNFVHAAGSEKLRIALIGCGGRGTGAAGDCLLNNDNVEFVAMGDLLKDRLENSKNELKGKLGDKFQVKEEMCFIVSAQRTSRCSRPMSIWSCSRRRRFPSDAYRGGRRSGQAYLRGKTRRDRSGRGAIGARIGREDQSQETRLRLRLAAPPSGGIHCDDRENSQRRSR